jgi:hypothetical protein
MNFNIASKKNHFSSANSRFSDLSANKFTPVIHHDRTRAMDNSDKELGISPWITAKDVIKKGRIPSNAALLPGFLPDNPEAVRMK